ncbi:hypothetical protein MMC25_002523 [Agyrium rufum]|nr:hypothetical protein [Agyrium rufum]
MQHSGKEKTKGALRKQTSEKPSCVNLPNPVSRASIQKSSSMLSQIPYFAETLYLLTLSDLDTFCIPQAAFGFFGALSGPILTTNSSPDLIAILKRLPLNFLWVWLNTVVFDLANQRLPDSVKEDSINKPWRPLAAGRLNTASATTLLLIFTPLTFALSWFWLGAAEETALLFSLTWMYNDMGGSDNNFVVRNVLIAGLYVFYSAGAMRVSAGAHDYTLSPAAFPWLAIIAGVIISTMHVQDLKDQDGDKARERKTLPLVVGHWATRWVIASLVLGWSIAAPMFWDLGIYGYSVSGILGLLVTGRVLLFRDRLADKKTWKVWSLWLTSLYFLPLFKDYSVFGRALEAFMQT